MPERDAVLVGEGEKIVPVYPVLAAGQLERHQVAFLDPPQDGDLADTAVPGYGSGRQINGVHFFFILWQLLPPTAVKHAAATCALSITHGS